MEETTLVELVFGRPPKDVVAIENSAPEQLTTPETARDLADRTLEHLAIPRSKAESRSQERHRSLPSS